MKTKHKAFSVYRKKAGTRFYRYARFWDGGARRYSVTRAVGIEASGKKGRRAEAELAAAAMLPSIKFSSSSAGLADYLTAFWQDDSPYFKEAELVRGRRLSAYYCKAARGMVRLHVLPYEPFKSIGIDGLTPGLIRDFMLWEAERGVSGNRINRVLQTIRVPVRYEIERGGLQTDPFFRVKEAAFSRREKGILAEDEVQAVIDRPAGDPKRRLGVLLGALCGMRLGEVRGLHWEDVDFEGKLVAIRHNWQDLEGVKRPKCGSFRAVPLPEPVLEAARLCREQAGSPLSGLVFGREDGRPLCNGFFRDALIHELDGIGIPGGWRSKKPMPEGWVNEQERRNITFHSLRHTFVSLCRLAGLNDFQVQALAGHKSVQQMDRYSHPNQAVDPGSCLAVLENFFQKK